MLRLDIQTRKVVATYHLPGAPPTGLALSGDGAELFVTCAAPESWVCAVDVATGPGGPTDSRRAYGHGPGPLPGRPDTFGLQPL